MPAVYLTDNMYIKLEADSVLDHTTKQYAIVYQYALCELKNIYKLTYVTSLDDKIDFFIWIVFNVFF